MSASKMLEEVRQQPDALQRTLKSELSRIGDLKRLVGARKPRFIVLVARGTSDNAAQFGRYLLEITTGIPVSLSAPSIFTLYEADVDLSGALLVAVSQSGESTDTNLVLERARAQGAMTVGITNESSSALAKIADYVFLVRAGKEKSVAATKTYTGQLLTLYLLAHALGGSIRIDDLKRLPDRTADALKLEDQVAASAQRYRFMEHALVVGRGLNYSNAFELALKLMETCYVVAERFSSADLLHGPIAMLEAGFPVFLFAPPGVTWPGLKQLIGRLSEIKTETLIITDESNRRAVKQVGGEHLAHKICIPADLAHKGGPTDLFTPIPYIVPAQLFAGWLAHVKGLDPDRPRSLKKVTQTM